MDFVILPNCKNTEIWIDNKCRNINEVLNEILAMKRSISAMQHVVHITNDPIFSNSIITFQDRMSQLLNAIQSLGDVDMIVIEMEKQIKAFEAVQAAQDNSWGKWLKEKITKHTQHGKGDKRKTSKRKTFKRKTSKRKTFKRK